MLRDYCITAEQTADYFVGIRWQHGQPQVVFPHGYQPGDEDAACRRDIFSLLASLRRFAGQKEGDTYCPADAALTTLPLEAYQYILYDFLRHGYYVEKESSYVAARRGKISWKRTIQQERPLFQDGNPIYLNFRVKQAQMNDEHLLSHIHRYCVYQAFLRFGWLFFHADFLPEKPSLPFRRNLFAHTLQQALNNTFNDEKRRLLTAMLHIVQENAEMAESQHGAWGVNSFAPVWERMVDHVFGESDKEKYFPHATWHILRKGHFVRSSALEPDTIMRYDGKLYVLDAKYYRYGVTRNPQHLPPTSSVQKQITYGQYAARIAGAQGGAGVYNAFIMPFDGGGITKTEFVSIGTADWMNYHSGTPNYAYVLGILMDTKWLMSNYVRHHQASIIALAETIENALFRYRSCAEQEKVDNRGSRTPQS